MSYEPYICELDPETKAKLTVYLYKNVKNVEEVRNGVISGTLECAVIKPSLVLHPLQIAAAANRAALARSHNSLVTRTVYAEILYNLSLTKNITQSLSKFGVEKERDLLVCILSTNDDECVQKVISQIQGDLCPISDLASLTNLKEVKSVYKINNLKNEADYLDAIISRMVTKNIVSH